jgi:hypothetical protein
VPDFEHQPHEHTLRHARGEVPPPPTVASGHVGVNGRIGLFITGIIGTMWAAYFFALVTLVALPSAVRTHNPTVIVGWFSSYFCQLVLLSIIIVGQNLQAQATDQRSRETYADAEAVLHEALQIQAHLKAQDAAASAHLAEQEGQARLVHAMAAILGCDAP